MKETVSGKVKIIIFVVGIICALTAVLGSRYVTNTQQTITETSEKAFSERPENSDATDSDYVKFDAYFEKDGKKYEGIRAELNDTVVLKTDLKVLTTGTLESASIELADGNFEMINDISETGFIKSVGTNKIEFNEMQPGDQIPININLKQNVVFAPEASEGDSYEYSLRKFNKNRLSKKDNKITFKGKYRRADGTIQDITKEITFRIDWYGEIHFESESGFGLKLGEAGTFIVDEENQKVYMVVNPFVYTKTLNSNNVLAPDAATIIEAELPEMNGYFPKSVTVNDMAKYKKDIQEPEYDSRTGILKVRIENPVDDNGEGYVVGVASQYKVSILIEYPYQAYDVGDTTNNYTIDAKAYLEGYSTEEETGEIVRVNSQEQTDSFSINIKDPKGSILLYHVNIVDDSLEKANSRLIYTKNVNVESTYRVDWSVNFYSYDNQIEKFVFAEDYTSAEKIDESAYKADFDHFRDDNKQYYNMEDFVNYIGIAVDEQAFDVLGEDGYIKVWDTDSGKEIKTIYSNYAGEYIEYRNSVKHIRIETSKPESVGTINIQNYKEIDNEALKQEYPNEETFDKFSHLYSSLHGKVKYRGQSGLKSINGDVKEIEYREGSTAYYPDFEYYNGNVFDPQKLNSNELRIYFYGPNTDHDKNYVAWIDPTIILEFPEAFQKIVYNSFRAEGLTVKDTEVSKVGEHVILKIKTEGIMETGDYGYLDFQSELDIPKSISDNKIRVFAHNSNCDNFEFCFTEKDPAKDIYDVDGDGDYNEERRVESVQIIYTQANSLITRTQITDFDKKGTIVECPGEGTVYYKENATGEARINVKVLNGYEQNINDVVIVGRIPFEGNKFTINSQNSLDSTFSTTMKADGVKGEEETLSYRVYYSESIDASKDDETTWKESVDNWDNIRSYKIVIEDEVQAKTSIEFYYYVTLPEKWKYGTATYATHAVYYKTRVNESEEAIEPDKVGLQIGDIQYTLDIIDYKFNTYNDRITYATEDKRDAKATVQLKGENYGDEWLEESKREVGLASAKYDNLYVGATYVVRQTEIDDPYILDTNEIRFRLVEDENGELEFQVLNEEGEPETEEEYMANGFIKNKSIGGSSKSPTLKLNIQNKYKYKIVVENKVKDKEEYINGSEFTIQGAVQEEGGNKKTADDGTATWGNYVLDQWTITQNTVGDEKYEKDNEEHTLNVTTGEGKELVVDGLGHLEPEDVWVENVDDFTKQPIVHVVIRNGYNPANIKGTKTGVVKLEDGTTREYAIEGDEITYTITLTNEGDKEGTAKVQDEVPEGTKFVEDSIVIKVNEEIKSGEFDEAALNAGIDIDVPARGTATLEFRVKVENVTEETKKTIENIATVTPEPDPENPEPAPEPQRPEVKTPIVKISKKAEVTRKEGTDIESNTVTMGDTITYTITVKNISEVEAKNVIVKDIVPEGTTFVSSKEGNPDEEKQNITWTIDTLAVEESKEVSFVVKVTSVPESGKIKNAATVGGEPTNEVELEYVKPEITVTKSSKVELKEDEKEERRYVTAGDTITYTLTIKNTGKAEGTVTIKDQIPEGVDFVEKSIKVKGKNGDIEAKPDGEYEKEDLTTNGITVKVGVNETKTLEFQVTVRDLESTAVIKNQGTYTVTGPNYDPDEPDPKPTPDPDPNEEHKTEEVENPYKEPEISSTKSAKISSGKKYAVPDDIITYTIEITNSGELAKKVIVKDSAPAGTTFVNSSVKVGKKGQEEARTEITEQELQRGIEVEVKENTTMVVSFDVEVNELDGEAKVGKIENTANVDGDDTPKVETTVDKSDLKISKFNEPEGVVTKGETITYRILLDNSEGSAPANVKVKDKIPTGTELVQNSIKVEKLLDGGNWQTEGQLYVQDNLEEDGIEVEVDAYSQKRVVFEVKVQDLTNGEKIENVATVTDTKPGSDLPPEQPKERQTNKVENEYVEADITAEKTASTQFGRNYVTEGEKITYTITIKNKGNLETKVNVKDSAPAHTEFVTDSIQIFGANDVKIEGKSYTEQELESGIDIDVAANSTAKLVFEVKVLKIEEESDVTIRNTATYKEKKDPEDPGPEPDPEEKQTPEVKTPVMKYNKKAEITRQTDEPIEDEAVTTGDVIKYIITVKNISEENASNIVVKDKIPEGTVLKTINNHGNQNGEGEITWTIASLNAGEETTVSFEVTVGYQTKDTQIRNVATVDGQPTNPEETPYKKPEPKLTHSVDKSGDTNITNADEKVVYRLKYDATIEDFKGQATITIVDTLPFPINDTDSELDEGTYKLIDGVPTITWTEELDVDSYTGQNSTIQRIKDLELKYIYPDGEELSGEVKNNVEVTIELKQKVDNPDDPENPQKDVVVKKETTEDDHTVHVEIPAEVVVHHYIWDESKGGATEDKLVEDEKIPGVVGQDYTTDPLTDEELDPNYECVNPEPDRDNHKGKMTKDPKEAVYYYKLKDPKIENRVDKTADIKLLTQEDGTIKYHIEQHVKVDEYKGKVTITITDTLPATINKEASELADGNYNPDDRTITWVIEENIDTFTDGAYEKTITKDIEIVYENQNVLESLVNTVNAKVTLYNPDNYTPDPGGERKTDEKQDTETVEQKYIIDKSIQKEWDDGNNRKGKRPSSVTVELKADGASINKTAVLNESNGWKVTFEDLPKYSNAGTEIVYTVVETETNPGDLKFYEAPTMAGENPIVVTNRYKTMQADVDAKVDKKGPEKITSSTEGVRYTITYNANLTAYIGDAKLKVVDYLPYHIDESKSQLNGGTYNDNTKTITWEVSMNGIDTYTDGTYPIEFSKDIVLVFKDMNPGISVLPNKVDAILDLYETDSSKTVTDTENTPVDIKGKLVVHYKDTATGEEITYEEDGTQKQYKYEEEGKVGDTYTTDRKTIPDYVLDHIEGDEVGTYPDGTVEVTYWYKSDKSGGIDVKWVDEDGNDIVPPEHIPGEGEPGKVGDPYHTEPKDFDDYVLDYVEGEPDGTLPEGTGEVVYHYKRRIGRVVVQYLEKGTEEELLPEKVEEYPVGDSYTTERERVPNYRRADPEPENKSGTVTKEDTYVKYYYERIPSGKVVTKHVDVETGEDILHPDEETGEYVPYGDVQEGYVGDSYTTEPEDIPYYKVVEELLPPNREGVFEEEDKEVIYYYVKQVFNFKVDKVITKATINGEEQKVLDGKLIKVEVVGSEMENTEVVITYKIRVENTGEIAGTATVVEKLPKHFTIGKEAYNEWTENEDGDLEAEVSLEPGETKEFTIKLTWKNGSENFGREINSAEIKGFENDAHYEDKDKEDNISEAEVVMGVKTGAPTHIFFIIYSVVILIAIAEVIVYVRKAKTIK